MSLSVAQDYQYAGSGSSHWWIWLTGSTEELDAVDHVIYTLDPTFPNPLRTVADRSTGFRLELPGSDPFTIYARVFGKDGSEHRLQCQLQATATVDGTVRGAVQLDTYQRDVDKGLDRAFDDADEQEIDLEMTRIVIFSDHHKGERDSRDRFLPCERAYNAALAYYLETGFRLIVLGDAEELWDSTPDAVLAAYIDTLELEAHFHSLGRYERYFGNHDVQWRDESEVSRHLRRLFPNLRVREAVKLRVVRGGERLGLIFLAHGHQGTLDTDRFTWLSSRVVQHVWRPLQRRLYLEATTPSNDFALRQRHDAAMYSWARMHPAKPVLIAGHTHRPVFWRSQPPPAMESEEDLGLMLESLRAKGAAPEELGRVHARLESVRAERRGFNPPPMVIDPPCYFNTGCCSFGDGDISGIEIADGNIRLVRWPDNDDEPLPTLLAQVDLAEVLGRVAV